MDLNRDILECKFSPSVGSSGAVSYLNRDILECKYFRCKEIHLPYRFK